MSINGIANFVQNVSGQSYGQAKEPPTGTNAPGAVNAGIAPVAEDIFTPSSQVDSTQATAQDAGIFQIAQGTAPSNTPNNPYVQTAANRNSNDVPGQASSAVNANTAAADNASTTSAGNATSTGQGASGTPSAQTAGAGAAAASEQVQIQALNAALPTLGLTNTEINQIDRIASLVHNFNPAAYASLVNQFEAQAQQNAPSSTATSPANQGASPPTSANGSGVQVQQILASSPGTQQSATGSGAPNGGVQSSAASNGQPAAPGVQLGKVQLTSNNTQTPGG
jgi:hypothetical protein